MLRLKKINYISILILLMSTSINAQEIKKDILENVKYYYDTVDILYSKVVYTMHRGYQGDNITETYSSTIYKNNLITQIKLLGSEIIQLNDIHVIVDNENKTITYSKIRTPLQQNSPIDVSTFKKYFKEIKRVETAQSIVLTMSLVKKSPLIPYNKIKLELNKNNYSIEKQVLFFASKLPFYDEKGNESIDTGRLEIAYNKLDTSNLIPPKEIDYLDNNKIPKSKLSKKYKNYKIIDQTNSLNP